MSNTGITESEVARAAQAIQARGGHPSIDAVRVELGNRGSKTTISKHLSSLRGRGAMGPRVATASERVIYLAEQLAEELRREAQSKLEEANEEHRRLKALWAEKDAERDAELQAALSDLAATRKQADVDRSTIEALQERVGTLQHQLDDRTRQAQDLQARLEEQADHGKGLQQALDKALNSYDQLRDDMAAKYAEQQIRLKSGEEALIQARREKDDLQVALANDLAKVRDALATEREAAARLAGDLAARDATLRDLQAALREQKAAGDTLKEKVDTAQREKAGLEAELTAAGKALDREVAARTGAEENLRALDRDLAVARAELARFRRSRPDENAE